jgi:hypothetical protein
MDDSCITALDLTQVLETPTATEPETAREKKFKKQLRHAMQTNIHRKLPEQEQKPVARSQKRKV